MTKKIDGRKKGAWTGKKRPNVSGVNHYLYKKEGLSYSGLHKWIVAKMGKAKRCSNKNCIYPRINKNDVTLLKPKRFEWANISNKYLRDTSDWVELCPSCHRKWDMDLIEINLPTNVYYL